MADRDDTQSIHDRLLQVLRIHPDGISITEIRHELDLKPTDQQHLDRRIRELDASYIIARERRGRRFLYKLVGPQKHPVPSEPIDKTTRARVIHMGGYRCQLCGRNVKEDGIKLQVDHKVPRDWGGSTEDDNLWALCSECNEGKRNFFATITDSRIQQAIVHGSVHTRLGELLKAFSGEPVPKAYLQIVAYTHDDFEKRLRELRELGWKYHVEKRKEGSRMRTYFVLDKWRPWPPDPAVAIRAAEAAKKAHKASLS